MISNCFELTSFAFAVLTAYELAGRVGAFAVLTIVCLVIGLALDGAQLPQLRKPKAEKKKRKRVDEPLTNERFNDEMTG